MRGRLQPKFDFLLELLQNRCGLYKRGRLVERFFALLRDTNARAV